MAETSSRMPTLRGGVGTSTPRQIVHMTGDLLGSSRTVSDELQAGLGHSCPLIFPGSDEEPNHFRHISARPYHLRSTPADQRPGFRRSPVARADEDRHPRRCRFQGAMYPGCEATAHVRDMASAIQMSEVAYSVNNDDGRGCPAVSQAAPPLTFEIGGGQRVLDPPQAALRRVVRNEEKSEGGIGPWG